MSAKTSLRLSAFVVSSALAAMLLSGCTGQLSGKSVNPSNPSNPGGSSTTAFSVYQVNPAPGAIQIASNSTIQVTFSQPADPSSVNSSDVVVTSTKPVAGTVRYDSDTNSAVFAPAAPLETNTTFHVTVSGVKSASGATMAGSFTSTFVTSATGQGGGYTGGGGNGGSGGGATVQYRGNMRSNVGSGEVTVDTAGMVTVNVTGTSAAGQPNAAYSFQFCPGADTGSGAVPQDCLTLGTLTADATGSGSATVKFPKSGSWAGDFQLMANGKIAYSTYLDTNSSTSGQVFLATLIPQTVANGGLEPGPQEQLGSGTISDTNGTITVTMQGAPPSTTYSIRESETTYMDSSGTYTVGQFTTDGSGNGSTTFSATTLSPGGDLFQVQQEFNVNVKTPAGFVGGFVIP